MFGVNFKTLAVASALSVTSGAAFAGGSIKDDGPPPVPERSVFGEIMGMYGMGASRNWQLFGPDVVSGPEMTKGGIGNGGVGKVSVGVLSASRWDFNAALQLARFGDGKDSVSPAERGELSATMYAVDALVGYRLTPGIRLAAGVRHAGWDNLVDPQFNRSINHKWTGTGPRIELATRTPLSGGVSLHADVGASYLMGRQRTSASAGWICIDCTNYDMNSFNIDGRLGVGFNLAANTDLIIGYRAEYWSGVNVKITDNTNIGGNEGRSGHLVHGPFMSLKMGLAP